MTSSGPQYEYRFAGFRLDAAGRQLYDPEGEALQIGSRAFDTLQELLSHAGQTLSKDDLMNAVWPGVIVEENNLNQAISSLRKSLGDSKAAPRFIQTIPGRGYRFIAPVESPAGPGGPAGAAASESEPVPSGEAAGDAPGGAAGEAASGATGDAAMRDAAGEAADPDPPVPAPSAPGGRRSMAPAWAAVGVLVVVVLVAAGVVFWQGAGREAVPATSGEFEQVTVDSVAVMPLTPLNEPEDGGVFALGLHDELIQQLARIDGLQVISRENVLSLADGSLSIDEVGRRLNAGTVLTGTVFYRGERARVRLQMSAPESGLVLWASSYEVDTNRMIDVVEAQSHIATNVASALHAEIRAARRGGTETRPTESFGAYRYLLAARNAYYFQNYAQTFSLTREAIALDPQFIDAHFYFATVNTVLTAVPLDGMNGADHQRLAMESAQRIIELAPYDSRGYTLRAAALATIGDWEGVYAEVERLQSMGVSLAEMKFYAHVLLALGDFDGAIEIYEANQLIEPVNLYGRGFMMAAHEMAGRPERARQEFLLGEELSPIWWGDTVNVFVSLGRHEPLTDIEQLPIPESLKSVLANIDDRPAVMQALTAYRDRERKRSAETVFYSAIAAYVDEHELAVELMRDALDGVWLSLHWMWLPLFDEARQLPAFRDLLVESGIVAYWDRHGWPAVCEPNEVAFTCNGRGGASPPYETRAQR